MPKGLDPFEKFKQATLSSPSLSEAIKPSEQQTAPVQAAPAAPVKTFSPAPVQEFSSVQEKPRVEQVSFFLDRELKRKFGMLKYELGVQYKDLYEEAIRDLLKKYDRL